jgi:hypothetical protein
MTYLRVGTWAYGTKCRVEIDLRPDRAIWIGLYQAIVVFLPHQLSNRISTMKLAVLTVLAGSAAAFAPAQSGKVRLVGLRTFLVWYHLYPHTF